MFLLVVLIGNLIKLMEIMKIEMYVLWYPWFKFYYPFWRGKGLEGSYGR